MQKKINVGFKSVRRLLPNGTRTKVIAPRKGKGSKPSRKPKTRFLLENLD